MSKNVISPRTRGRVVAATVLAAGAIAVGALGQAIPAAQAMPIGEKTIKSECQSAGGAYQFWGTGVSTCTYQDISGNLYRDYFVNGVYTRTD
jgi:hypothetical protein